MRRFRPVLVILLLMVVGQSVALARSSVNWSGEETPITPFDLRIMSAGFYGLEKSDAPRILKPSIELLFRQATLFKYEGEGLLDEWQKPEATYKRKAGDCEDIALWLYSQLIAHGYENLRFVIGKFRQSEIAYHAWVVYEDAEGLQYILDPALQNHVWRRSELSPVLYRPTYSFDGDKKYQHQPFINNL